MLICSSLLFVREAQAGESAGLPLESDDFALHGQTTYVQQYAPSFHAPYAGTNSLVSNETRETWDLTAYAGLRLWPGAEFWFNPEIDQGFGLSGTRGLAGYRSGEAYKVGAAAPYVRIQRAFIRQAINLGGDAGRGRHGTQSRAL